MTRCQDNIAKTLLQNSNASLAFAKGALYFMTEVPTSSLLFLEAKRQYPIQRSGTSEILVEHHACTEAECKHARVCPLLHVRPCLCHLVGKLQKARISQGLEEQGTEASGLTYLLQ